MHYQVGSITSRCSRNEPAEIGPNYWVNNMKTLIFRGRSKDFSKGRSHTVSHPWYLIDGYVDILLK